jgi:type III restriction enzyme
MKLKFKSQSFQTAAVNAVVDIFKGQRKSADAFTITNEKQLIMDENGMASAIVGTANVLQISDEKITENMNAVQKRFSLPVTNDEPHSFCIEMETGTGKTYVYTKTIYELYKHEIYSCRSERCDSRGRFQELSNYRRAFCVAV